MIASRPIAVDVSQLPTSTFGSRDIMWWGTVGFMAIEGFTLVLCATVYVYITGSYPEWPPAGTPRPDLIAPTVLVVLMIGSLALMKWLSRVAHEKALEKVRLGLTAGTLVSAMLVALRLWEVTRSINVRWDANAYGSAQWLLLLTHGTLLLMQLIEIAGMAAIFWLGPIEKKHFSDAADVAFYWDFIVLAWLPLYVLCFLLPHWL